MTQQAKDKWKGYIWNNLSPISIIVSAFFGVITIMHFGDNLLIDFKYQMKQQDTTIKMIKTDVSLIKVNQNTMKANQDDLSRKFDKSMLEIDYRFKLLNIKMPKPQNATYGEHYHYSDAGKRIVTMVPINK